MWAVEPSNPSKVKVYGPGVEKGVKTNQPTFFTVDCRGAGSGMYSNFVNIFLDSFFLWNNQNQLNWFCIKS